MLWYYKRHFLDTAARLNELRRNPDNLDLLFDLQMTICRRVVHAEKKQSKYQERCWELKRTLSTKTSRSDSKRLKQDLARNERKRKACQWLQYIWRCFGDGIVYCYVSKWGVKPFHFQTKAPDPKLAAGHLSGKAGLAAEISVVLNAKNHGVPAILSDVTNTIRHGDVCLLGADEPYVIEVKSSQIRSKRADRQISDIEALHSYLEDEVADDVRGVPRMHRVATAIDERDYIDLVCPLIRNGLKKGFHTVVPERGIRYSAIRVGQKIDFAQTVEGMETPIITNLNSAKNDCSWSIYYPFTLSISEPDLLYEFVKGDVFITVATDMETFSTVAREKGFYFDLLDDPDYVFQLTECAPADSDPMTCKISRGFAARIAFEFMSWEWVVENERKNIPVYREKIALEVGR